MAEWMKGLLLAEKSAGGNFRYTKNVLELHHKKISWNSQDTEGDVIVIVELVKKDY